MSVDLPGEEVCLCNELFTTQRLSGELAPCGSLEPSAPPEIIFVVPAAVAFASAVNEQIIFSAQNYNLKLFISTCQCFLLLTLNAVQLSLSLIELIVLDL